MVYTKLMENTVTKNICPNCGSTYNVKVEGYEKFTTQEPNVGHVTMRACASCGTVFVSEEDRQRMLKKLIPKDAFKD